MDGSSPSESDSSDTTAVARRRDLARFIRLTELNLYNRGREVDGSVA